MDEKREDCRQVFENRLIMENVFEYLHCTEIQRLRKTCRGIRQTIDIIEPDPKIKVLVLSVGTSGTIYMSVEDVSIIRYVKTGNGCFVGSRSVPEDFFEVLKSDLKANIEHQKLRMDEIQIEIQVDFSLNFWNRGKSILQDGYARTSEFYSWRMHRPREIIQTFRLIGEVLKNKVPLLKVFKISIEIATQEELMLILPYIDDLQTINISSFYEIGELEIGKVSKLNQWKMARELKIKKHQITTPVREIDFSNFESGDILIDSISNVDVFHLKKTFQNSKCLKRFKIVYCNSTTDSNLYEQMGIPNHRSREPAMDVWYYSTPNPNRVLHIVHHIQKAIIFSHREPSTVPEEMVLGN